MKLIDIFCIAVVLFLAFGGGVLLSGCQGAPETVSPASENQATPLKNNPILYRVGNPRSNVFVDCETGIHYFRTGSGSSYTPRYRNADARLYISTEGCPQ